MLIPLCHDVPVLFATKAPYCRLRLLDAMFPSELGKVHSQLMDNNLLKGGMLGWEKEI
jgi:hypothetical protein